MDMWKQLLVVFLLSPAMIFTGCSPKDKSASKVPSDQGDDYAEYYNTYIQGEVDEDSTSQSVQITSSANKELTETLTSLSDLGLVFISNENGISAVLSEEISSENINGKQQLEQDIIRLTEIVKLLNEFQGTNFANENLVIQAQLVQEAIEDRLKLLEDLQKNIGSSYN